MTVLKELLSNEKRKAIQISLEGLTATKFTEYLLWRDTKRPIPSLGIKEGEWAKNENQETYVFAEHVNVFSRCFDSEISEEEENEILPALINLNDQQRINYLKKDLQQTNKKQKW